MQRAGHPLRIVLAAALVGAALLGGVASAEDPPRAPGGGAPALPPPEAPPEKPGRDVVLVTDDGMRIAATAWASGGAANGPGVVLLHMYRHERSTWAPLVPYLLERGVAVIAIDLRGHGGSAKQGKEDLSQRVEKRDAKVFAEMHRDAMAAVTWLAAEGKCDAKRIALVGASVGCSVAIDTARRHPGATAAVVCMTPGANYLGLDSLEHAKTWPAGEPLLLLTHEEEADVGSKALHAAVPGSRLVVYDEKPSGDAKDQEGWAHGTRMFGRMALVERTVASFVAARTGSKLDDVVLDGVVDAEGAPGADPWAKSVDVAGPGGRKAWAYRVGRRIAFGGIIPPGCRQVRVWVESGTIPLPKPVPCGVPGDVGFPACAGIDVAAGRVAWMEPSPAPAPRARGPGDGSPGLSMRPPDVRIAGATFEGEWYAPHTPANLGDTGVTGIRVVFDTAVSTSRNRLERPSEGMRDLPSR